MFMLDKFLRRRNIFLNTLNIHSEQNVFDRTQTFCSINKNLHESQK